MNLLTPPVSLPLGRQRFSQVWLYDLFAGTSSQELYYVGDFSERYTPRKSSNDPYTEFS